MAFDRPIEADRVDNLSFFGLLSKGPIIGSIMWFLGGQKAREEEERELRRQHDLESLFREPAAQPRYSPPIGTTARISKSALRKSDTLSDCANAMDEMTMNEKPLKRQRKNISWSDEGGKDLVEIIGQVREPCGNGVTAHLHRE